MIEIFNYKAIKIKAQRAQFLQQQNPDIFNKHLHPFNFITEEITEIAHEIAQVHSIALNQTLPIDHITYQPPSTPQPNTLLTSFYNLSTCNTLPTFLKTLKDSHPSSLLCGTLFGTGNLVNFKEQIITSESQFYNQKIHLRVMPFINSKSMGDLLHTLGYQGIMCHSHRFNLSFLNLRHFVYFLRYTGQTNPLHQAKSNPIAKKIFKDVEKTLRRDNKITIDFEIVSFLCRS